MEGLHTLVAIVAQYLLIHIIGPTSFMIGLSFAFQMIYLVVGYLIYSTDLYDIAWTTAQCIVVLRLLGKAMLFSSDIFTYRFINVFAKDGALE
mgnify:CR=1 FL=1